MSKPKRRGFFPASEGHSKAPAASVPYCGACGLYKKCNSPKMEPSGNGDQKILIIGEAPSLSDDEAGRHFTGAGGRKLRTALRKCGVDIESDCISTYALICKPSLQKQPPSPEQLEFCRPNLVKTIETHKPSMIIPLGGPAVQALLKHFWKSEVGSIHRWVGFQVPMQRLNAWVCPTFDPGQVVREEKQNNSVMPLMFDTHIERACRLSGKRPWDVVPNYKEQVEVIHEPLKAAKVIRGMIKRGGLCAFDYETNMLKPDGEDAEIVSCSICWRGKRTIAYPWVGPAVQATSEFLKSPIPKIASNLKFEDRWTRAKLKHGVRNWKWDTMIAAHIVDNRPEICSIKFQSFAYLGAASWNEHIEKHFRSGGTRVPNSIHEISMDDLLLYNGLDSLLEYLVAIKQMEFLNYES